MKKIIISVLFLIFFCNFVFATQTIDNLKVPSDVPLQKNVTIFGEFNDTTAADSNVLCSFFIIDQNGYAITRAQDEYTNDNGTFYSEILLTEPLIHRGKDYNIVVECGTASETAQFTVQNFEMWLSDYFNFSLLWWQKNWVLLMFVIIMFGFIFFVFYNVLRGMLPF